jgi:diguanylate cyclase (GGDEF)-like protein
MFIMLGWVTITVRSKTSFKTYIYFFCGCANLVWLMTIKFFGELFVEQTAILTFFELLLAVAGILLITLGLMSWSKDFQLVIEKLQISTSNYRVLSETDPLTGLLNRGQFDTTLNQVAKPKDPFSLILVDLDHFKSINDQYGHPVGEEVVERTAKLLGTHLRDKDYAFRLGGEEFALLYIQCPEEVVVQRAQTILKKIAQEPFSVNDDQVFSITASLGVVHRNQNDQASTIYKRADSALYQAKENGRNQVIVL